MPSDNVLSAGAATAVLGIWWAIELAPRRLSARLLRSRTGVLELVDLAMQRSALSSRDRLSDPRRGGRPSGDVRTSLRTIRADDKAHRSLGVLRHSLTTGFQ